MARLLWIGLGNMGRGMCKNLVEKGNLEQPLLVYNRSIERAIDLRSKLPSGKIEVVKSISDGVGEADIIFLCLSNDAAVEETVKATLETHVYGKVIVDCSTIHPDTTKKIAEMIEGQGAAFVAAPVFGAPAAADAGQLIFVVAGSRVSVDRVRPLFKDVMGRGEIDMIGEPHQKATTLKLLGNTFVLNMVEQLAEAHVVAERCGLGTKYVHQFVENMFPGPYTAYSTRMLSGDYYKREEPLFAVDLARKDAAHAMNLARSAGARFQSTETADAHLEKVKEHNGERGDIAGIYGAVRMENGLPFENGN